MTLASYYEYKFSPYVVITGDRREAQYILEKPEVQDALKAFYTALGLTVVSIGLEDDFEVNEVTHEEDVYGAKGFHRCKRCGTGFAFFDDERLGSRRELFDHVVMAHGADNSTTAGYMLYNHYTEEKLP